MIFWRESNDFDDFLREGRDFGCGCGGGCRGGGRGCGCGARILIDSARFPPFGFDIKEIGSDSHEGMVSLQKN